MADPKKSSCLFVFSVVLTIAFAAIAAAPKNIIIFVGDGMGLEQVKAAGMYANGREGTLSFEQLPYRAELTTHSDNREVTDSAAAATALATGIKVKNGVISIAKPGDGSDLTTILEMLKDDGKRVGLVTTTYVEHATPAAFGAHTGSRNNHSDIAKDLLERTRPHVLFGGAKKIDVTKATDAGYKVVRNRAELIGLDFDKAWMVSGQFGDDYMPYEYDGLGDLPHLSEMTTAALDILDNGAHGFFLMVEGGRIDHACHDNDQKRMIPEVIEFANAVDKAIQWMGLRNDTLIIVTADHETGGLKVLKNNGPDKVPDVKWSTGGHTSANVPLYAIGLGAEAFFGILDNTELCGIIMDDDISKIAVGAAAINEGTTVGTSN